MATKGSVGRVVSAGQCLSVGKLSDNVDTMTTAEGRLVGKVSAAAATMQGCSEARSTGLEGGVPQEHPRGDSPVQLSY